jgi:hypothetical protein
MPDRPAQRVIPEAAQRLSGIHNHDRRRRILDCGLVFCSVSMDSGFALPRAPE